MAAQTFAALAALGRRPVPSDTVASIVSGYVRFTEVNGPFKTEWNIFQVGSGDNFTDADTFKTGLVHPIAAEVVWANVDGAAGAAEPTAELDGVESSATYRTVTVNDAHGTAAAGLIVRVIGF